MGYSEKKQTFLAISPRLRKRTINTKKPVVIGGFGNLHRTIAASSAKVRRGQTAHIQGRNGLSPRDHRAMK